VNRRLYDGCMRDVQGERSGLRRSGRYLHGVRVPDSGCKVCSVFAAMDADELHVCSLPSSHQRCRRCRSLRHSVKLLLPPLLDHSAEKFRSSSGQLQTCNTPASLRNTLTARHRLILLSEARGSKNLRACIYVSAVFYAVLQRRTFKKASQEEKHDTASYYCYRNLRIETTLFPNKE